MSEADNMTVGNYQLKNCVASGATTQIWECTEAGSPMQLAMKLMLEDARKIAAEKSVLKHEFKVGQSLEHPAFLRFHEIEINRDHAFFVMDFFRSPSLKTHITANLPGVQSCFPKMAEDLARSFQYMHENGWLHRDIKPDNILVNKAGEIRVIDFSLSAKVKGKLGLMLAGKSKNIQGTRTYIAPETILRKPATEHTDMYSLGVTFFEVLTGHPPFAGDTPSDLLKKHLGEEVVAPSIFNPNVTKDLDRIILQMLKKNPKERFESMQEVAQELAKIKCFEEDPVEVLERKLREEREVTAQSVDQRLNSRADAERTAKGESAPALPQKKKHKISPKFLKEEENRKARIAAGQKDQQPAPVPQPMQQGMQYPGQMPMQPGMPYPGQMPMQPGMPYPGQMPMQPGMPYPGQMPMQPGMPMPHMPGQPMPQQPMQMPQQQQPVPAQPPAPQATAPQQPAAAQPAAPQPSAPQQPAAPQPAAPPPQPAATQPAAAAPAPAKEEPTEATLEDMMDIMTDLDIE